VLSTIHVKHLVEMAPVEAWDDDFRFGVESWRAGVSMFVTHYATREPPRFITAEDALVSPAAGIPVSVDRMLRRDPTPRCRCHGRPGAAGACQDGDDPSRAPIDAHPKIVVPALRADGPARWDEIQDQVSQANLEHFRRFVPNLTDEVILASRVESPLDLERRNSHNWHGTCHGGDMSPAQSGMMRPVPGWASHRTPIANLYQTGATTHTRAGRSRQAPDEMRQSSC
jgi:hypothetical protein